MRNFPSPRTIVAPGGTGCAGLTMPSMMPSFRTTLWIAACDPAASITVAPVMTVISDWSEVAATERATAPHVATIHCFSMGTAYR